MFLFIVLRRISFTNQFRSDSRRKDKHKNHACQSYKYMKFHLTPRPLQKRGGARKKWAGR